MNPIALLQHPLVRCELTPATGIPKCAVAGFDRRVVGLPVLCRPRLADEQPVTTSIYHQS
jgi:hypothetical protein